MTPKIPEALIARKCKVCVHCRIDVPNQDSAVSALHATFQSPCQIYAIAQVDFDEPECMTFAPRLWVAGICQTCKNRNRFFPTGCRLEITTRRIVYRTCRPIAQAECYTCDDYTPGWMADGMVYPDVAPEAVATVLVRPAAPAMRRLTPAELDALSGFPTQTPAQKAMVQQVSMELEGMAR